MANDSFIPFREASFFEVLWASLLILLPIFIWTLFSRQITPPTFFPYSPISCALDSWSVPPQRQFMFLAYVVAVPSLCAKLPSTFFFLRNVGLRCLSPSVLGVLASPPPFIRIFLWWLHFTGLPHYPPLPPGRSQSKDTPLSFMVGFFFRPPPGSIFFPSDVAQTQFSLAGVNS